MKYQLIIIIIILACDSIMTQSYFTDRASVYVFHCLLGDVGKRDAQMSVGRVQHEVLGVEEDECVE